MGHLTERRVGTTVTIVGSQLGDEGKGGPSTTEQWSRRSVSYREFDGWPDADWDAVARRGYEAIPENAREYVEYGAAGVGVPVHAVGVGPGREEPVVLEDPFA